MLMKTTQPDFMRMSGGLDSGVPDIMITGRRRHLGRVTDNSRFLIRAGVRVPHLASHLLGRISRRLSRGCQARYGHPIHRVET
jgi:hypothetical protein